MKKRVGIFLALVFTAVAVIWWQPSSGWYLYDILARKDTSETLLILENQSLRAELSSYKENASLISLGNEYRMASVYGRMLGATKGKIIIALGEDDGARIGQGVYIVSPAEPRTPVLVGRIEAVYANVSRVITLFDAAWESAVHVGPKKREALLVGGNFPRLTLIEKENGGVKEGDIVRNASPDLRYGTLVGEVANVQLANDRLREEADLKFGYTFGSIRAVYVYTAFHGISDRNVP